MPEFDVRNGLLFIKHKPRIALFGNITHNFWLYSARFTIFIISLTLGMLYLKKNRHSFLAKLIGVTQIILSTLPLTFQIFIANHLWYGAASGSEWNWIMDSLLNGGRNFGPIIYLFAFLYFSLFLCSTFIMYHFIKLKKSKNA